MTDSTRRSCDTDWHNSPCEKLKLTATIQDQMFAMLEDIQRENAKQSKQLDAQADMLAAWNNTKGFVTTVQAFGKLLLWVVAITGAIVIVLHGIRDYLLAGSIK